MKRFRTNLFGREVFGSRKENIAMLALNSKSFTALTALVVATLVVSAFVVTAVLQNNVVTGQTTGKTQATVGQVTSVSDTDIFAPDCGGSGEQDCTQGEIFLYNKYSKQGSDSDETDFSYRIHVDGSKFAFQTQAASVNRQLAENALPPPFTPVEVDTVYASYQSIDNNGEVENYIAKDSNVLVVRVVDGDQITTRDESVKTALTISGGNGTLVVSESDKLPIVDIDGDGNLLEDISILETKDNEIINDTDTAPNIITGRARAFNAADEDITSLAILVPFSLNQDSPGTTRQAAISFSCSGSGCGDVVQASFNWKTADERSSVWIEVSSASNNDNIYYKLNETDRGTGVFVGEIRVLDPLLEVEIAALGVYGTNPESPRQAIAFGRNGSDITVRYRDKEDESSAGTNQFRTISAEARIDNQAPEINITSPDHNFTTTSQRPIIESNVTDTGSGLDVDKVGLYIDVDFSDDENTLDVLSGVRDANSDGDRDDQPVYDNDAQRATTNLGKSRVIDVEDEDNFQPTSTGDNIGTTGQPEVPGNIRVKLGEANEDGDDFYTDEYEDGAENVDIRYRPSSREQIFENRGDDEIDNQVDYQFFAIDLAGNVEFSDNGDEEDAANGEDNLSTNQPHVIQIDRKAPALIGAVDINEDLRDFQPTGGRIEDRELSNPNEDIPNIRVTGSAITGVSWDSSNSKLIVDRNVIWLVFNDSVIEVEAEDFRIDFSTSGVADPTVNSVIVPENVTVSTVDHDELDDGDKATVAGLLNRSVFLILSTDIPSADEPTIRITGNITDAAGNDVDSDRDVVVAEDGLGPLLTVSFSGGSGIGSDDDNRGPTTRTNNRMLISISSDEQGTSVPRVYFYAQEKCTSRVATPPPANTVNKIVRCGASTGRRATTRTSTTWDLTFRESFGNDSGAKSVRDRGGAVPIYVVVRFTDENNNTAIIGANGDPNKIEQFDNLAAFEEQEDRISFGFDNLVPVPDQAGQKIERNSLRPTLQLTYKEAVELVEVLFDDVDVTSQFRSNNDQNWLFIPSDELEFGEDYALDAKAKDFANNTNSSAQNVTIQIRERDNFIVPLQLGWNAISFPSDPVDNSVSSVFTDTAIQQVLAYNPFKVNPWEVATRSGGTVSGTNTGLREVEAGVGYWVQADDIGDVDVALIGPESGGRPDLVSVPVQPGWNFLGVVDQTRGQTQNDEGEVLLKGTDLVIANNQQESTDYFGAVAGADPQAYWYDSGEQRFVNLDSDDDIEIGRGYWVYVTNTRAPFTP